MYMLVTEFFCILLTRLFPMPDLHRMYLAKKYSVICINYEQIPLSLE